MRRFSAEYLERTRTGMWADSREALSILDLPDRERVLDAGAGTGELTRVLREESPGPVVALDADRSLLARVDPPTVVGDTLSLPFVDESFDLVVCQALLVNLVEPRRALREFVRVSSENVAVIEPDNSAVTVESTVESEPGLARRARKLYLDGVDTDPTLGDARDLFESVGLDDIRVRRYDHERTVEPPYSAESLDSARQKASGEGITTDRETILAGETTPEEFDDLRAEWRRMGRSAIEQIGNEAYQRREVVPFYVTVGSV